MDGPDQEPASDRNPIVIYIVLGVAIVFEVFSSFVAVRASKDPAFFAYY